MKTFLSFAFTLLTFCLLAPNLNAQVDVKNVVLANPPATACSNTDLIVSGEIWSTYPLDRIDVTVTGLNIRVDVIYDGGGITIPTVTKFSHTVPLGKLSAGNYMGVANGYLDTARKSSLPFNFTVAASGLSVNLGPDTLMCEKDSLLLNAFSSGSSYLWSDNSTNSSLLVKTAGTYFVTVTDSAGCVAVDTVIVTTKKCNVGLAQLDLEKVSAYPNPSSDFFNLTFSTKSDRVITLCDLNGKTLRSEFSNQDRHRLDVSEFADGVYLVRVNSGEDVRTLRLVKN